MENWLSSAEQVLIFCHARRKKVIGFVAPAGSAGVTTCAWTTAGVAAQSGYRTLLINLSKQAQPEVRTQTWVHTTANPLSGHISNATPFDLLILNATDFERYHFNNPAWFPDILVQEVERYDLILLDLPAIIHRDSTAINPIAVLQACDCVLLVCEPDRLLRRDLVKALHVLDSAGRRADGVILNQGRSLTMRADIIRAAKRYLRFSPSLVSWIEKRAQNSTLLD